MRALGTETEYGILAPEAPELSPAFLSAAVVASHAGPATAPALDWSGPIPIEDAHNRFVSNGARLYVDHAHPEFSAPETASPLAAVAYDLAGDEIVRAAAEAASATLGTPVRCFKNNTDGKGASYGFHENYLVPRDVAWGAIVAALTVHLVTRLPLTGAGRVGLGVDGREPGFQLSQRADFFEQVTGIETTLRRPIVNTRDEPHADPRRWRRVHVIAGDANRAHTSKLLTVGTTAAVLDGVAAGAVRPPLLADPLAAIRTVSRDLACRVAVPLADGRRATALDLQAELLTQVEAAGLGDPAVLGLWGDTIDTLRRDPADLADRLDWAAKLRLLEGFRDRDQLPWDHPRLALIDLQYAELDPARSVYATLVRAGRLRELIPADEVARAVGSPPDDTRAFLRGSLVAAHADDLVAVDWGSVTLRHRGGRFTLALPDPGGHTRAVVGAGIAAGSPDAVVSRLAR